MEALNFLILLPSANLVVFVECGGVRVAVVVRMVVRVVDGKGGEW